MTFNITCSNGHRTQVAAEAAGQIGYCPVCGSPIRAAPRDDELVLDTPDVELAADADTDAHDRLLLAEDELQPGDVILVADDADEAIVSASPASRVEDGHTARARGRVIFAWGAIVSFLACLGMGAAVGWFLDRPHADPGQISLQVPASVAAPPASPAPEQVSEPIVPAAAAATVSAGGSGETPLGPSLGPKRPPETKTKEEAPVVVRLRETATAFAINPATGALAAVSAESGTITLYRPDYLGGNRQEIVGPVRIGNEGFKPACITYKNYLDQHWFLVGGIGDAIVYALDAQTLNVVATVPVSVAHVVSVETAASPREPHVYYGGYWAEEDEYAVGQSSLAAGLDKGLLSGQRALNAFDCQVSARGTFHYPRSGYLPMEIGACRVYDQRISDRRVISVHANQQRFEFVPRIVPDPFESYAAIGHAVYTADLGTRVGQFDFDVKCFFPDRPLVAGLSGSDVCLGSLNSLRTVGRRGAPRGLLPPVAVQPTLADDARHRQYHVLQRTLGGWISGAPTTWHSETRLFADPGHSRLLLCHQDQVALFPLADFQLPAEPLLRARIDDPVSLLVGESLDLPVIVTDPSVKCELSAGPEGMALSAGRLKWTPSVDQAGGHVITLQLTAGTEKSTQQVAVEVRHPRITASFPIHHITLRRNGQEGVIWNEPQQSRTPVPPRIGWIDLKKRQVMAEGSSDLPIEKAFLDEHYIYAVVLKAGGGQVLPWIRILSRTDLSLVKEWPLGRNSSIELAPGFLLADQLWKLPELTPAGERPDLRRGALGGWLAGGILYDETLTTPRLLVEIRSLFPANQVAAEGSAWEWQRLRPSVPTGSPLASNPESGLSLTFFRNQRQDGPSPVLLDVYDLVQNAPIRRLPLAGDWKHEFGRSELAAAGDVAAVVLSERVIPLEIKSIAPNLARPLRFEPRQSAFVLAPIGPTRLTYFILGGQAPYSVAGVCRAYLEGGEGNQQFTARSADGTVEIELDRDVACRAAVSQLIGRVGIAGLAEFRGHTSSACEALTGNRPTGFAVPIAVSLTATDANQKKCSLGHWVYLDVPLSKVREALAQLE